jgi:acyl-CoA thioester hydrolase
MRPSFPSVEQVRSLPHFLKQIIPPEFEDINGHVNIQHYLGLYDKAGWPFFALLGMDERYFSEERNGIFDLEHHLFYLAEIHIGDEVAIHGRLVARSAKRLHGIWFIVNETRNQLSNTFEFVSTHADLETRRTSPFPDDLAERLDAMIAEHHKLEWPAPLCGIMGA